nr:hypothetical protein Iba_scaffold7474CG0010 [Ipomoea batatas]
MAADHQSSLPGVCAAAFAGRPPLNRQCCCQSREFVLRRQIASKKDNGSSTPLLLEFLIGLPNLSTPLVCRGFFAEAAGDRWSCRCVATFTGVLRRSRRSQVASAEVQRPPELSLSTLLAAWVAPSNSVLYCQHWKLTLLRFFSPGDAAEQRIGARCSIVARGCASKKSNGSSTPLLLEFLTGGVTPPKVLHRSRRRSRSCYVAAFAGVGVQSC